MKTSLILCVFLAVFALPATSAFADGDNGWDQGRWDEEHHNYQGDTTTQSSTSTTGQVDEGTGHVSSDEH
jgi:hypothetical protein